MNRIHLFRDGSNKRCVAADNYSIVPRLIKILSIGLIGVFILDARVEAQSTAFTYQGRLSDVGLPAEGSYDFDFIVWDSDAGGSMVGAPLNHTNVWVENGLFSVPLDFGAGVFDGPDRWLEISVQTNGGGGYIPLFPRTYVSSTPYAIQAGTALSVPFGSIGSGEVANNSLTANDLASSSVGASEIAANAVGASELASNSVGTSEVADGSLQGADLANNTVTSAQLADVLDLGDASNSGRLDVYRTTSGDAGISLVGGSSQISTYGSDGLEQIRLWGSGYGEILLHDGTSGNGTTVRLTANSSSGGALYLRNTNSQTRAVLSGANAGGYLDLYADDGSSSVSLLGDSSDAGLIEVRNSSGASRVSIDGQGYGSGGEITLDESDGSLAVEIQASGGGKIYLNDNAGQTAVVVGGTGSLGGYQYLYNRNGTATLYLDGDSSVGGYLSVRNTNGSTRVALDGYGAGGGGHVYLYANDGSTTVQLLGEDNAAGMIRVNDSVSQTRVLIDGESTGTGGEISVYDNDGTETVQIIGAEGSTQGAEIALRRADGTTTITLDADFNGDGRIITDELQITGGSDLSEQFDIDGLSQDVMPGMIVCIDVENPGKLAVSTSAYDRTVAGVVSGAGGVKPGMLMGQSGSVADGEHPVALSGRVYCMVDASQDSIQPGDMITTSTMPGHGMKVSDHRRAQGAIIGKAMTPLVEGQGLVLVLVSLQ